MKKATCTTFVNTLNTLHKEGITTKAKLMADQILYTEFWFALTEFVHYCLLSKTSKKNNEGEIGLGNVGKIDILEFLGATTRTEIETDCVIKIIEKLDLVLRQPIEKQKNYCYVICNNMVNDCFRKLPPDDIKVVSLYSTIEGTSLATEDAYTYEDVYSDYTYEPSCILSEKETIRELEKVLKAKQTKELAAKKAKEAKELIEKRNTILTEVALLSKHPAEVLCRLACLHLAIKPRELAAHIIHNGGEVEVIFAEIILEICKKYKIEVAEIRDIITGHKKLTAKDLWAENNIDLKKISSQISRLNDRAKRRISSDADAIEQTDNEDDKEKGHSKK